MSENCRQHYNLATGKGLDKAPSGKSVGAKRGGQVKTTSKRTGGKTPC